MNTVASISFIPQAFLIRLVLSLDHHNCRCLAVPLNANISAILTAESFHGFS